MIRAIIFDCFGVLVGASYSAVEALCNDEQKNELRALAEAGDIGRLSDQEYIAAIAKLLDRPAEVVHELVWSSRQRDETMLDFVRKTKQQYKTAMLSNVSDGVMSRIFSAQEFDALFDTVVLSYQEGIAKPDPAIYKVAAARLGLQPSECCMVDDRQDYCEGARMSGMQAIHFTMLTELQQDIACL